ncbi:MAG: hypothetical protein ACOCRO_08870 [Halanaerobiales bacterium]
MGDIQKYSIIRIPPFLLLNNAWLTKDWFVQIEDKTIHFPRRIVEKIQGAGD